MYVETIDEQSMRDLERNFQRNDNPSVQAAQADMIRRWLYVEGIGTPAQRKDLRRMLDGYEDGGDAGGGGRSGPGSIPFVVV